MALEQEMKTYDYFLDALQQNGHGGKYVVISGRYLDDSFDTYDEALKFAYEKYGMVSFLVKEIENKVVIPDKSGHYVMEHKGCKGEWETEVYWVLVDRDVIVVFTHMKAIPFSDLEVRKCKYFDPVAYINK